MSPRPGEIRVLDGNNIPALAKYMKSDQCKNIVVLLGAGVSTSAGIPDFRSPKTGLYANLARLNLPHPEAVFDMTFFRRNPVPFYTLAHEIYPGKYRPTITHSFIRLLSERGLLYRCFTQNIDTLERRAGVPDHKIIEAHGSFATQRCIDCKSPYDDTKMKEKLRLQQVPHCEECSGIIKPDIVFFGEQLPREFISNIPALSMADLVFVMGTSLMVHPFASLAGLPSDYCPRVLINLDLVGDFGDRPDDVILLGKCDDTVKALCKEMGWEEELTRLWDETASSVTALSDPEFGQDEDEEDLYADAQTNGDEVEKLAKQMTAAMALKDVTEKIQEKQSEKGEDSGEGSGESTPTNAEKDRTSDTKTETVIQGQQLSEQKKEEANQIADAGKL